MDELQKVWNGKPLLRGHFHQAAFFIALGACAMLIAKSNGPRPLTATLIYSVSLTLLLGWSALYHRPMWEPKVRAWMKRIDHAFIFVLIAGTGTPVCLLAMPADKGLEPLLLIWSAAGIGIIQSLVWTKAPKWVSAILYVTVGWLMYPYLPEIQQGLSPGGIALIVAGGIVYTVGAVIYALKKPNFVPKYFGYHELFHVFVIIAAILHFLAINQLVV